MQWMSPKRTWKPHDYVFTAFCVIVGIIVLDQLLPPIFGRSSNTAVAPAEAVVEDSKYPAPVQHGPYASYWIGSHWPAAGWADIEYMFVYGDSWTTTGFEIDQAQPNHVNPLGNPDFPGAVATNGANWVGYLIGTHNLSSVLTANFAYGGATVDEQLIHPFDGVPPGMRAFKYQVFDLFLSNYSSKPEFFPWDEDRTLFAIWIGLNDLHNANDKTKFYFGLVQERFADYLDQMYLGGARNFLLLNIPPIERSPLAAKINTEVEWHEWVTQWNANLTSLAANLTQVYPDATTIIFDAYKFFGDVTDRPTDFEESKGFLDTTTFCWAYAFGALDPYEKHPECPYSIDKYLWMNDLHPTSPMFNTTAHVIADALTWET